MQHHVDLLVLHIVVLLDDELELQLDLILCLTKPTQREEGIA